VVDLYVPLKRKQNRKAKAVRGGNHLRIANPHRDLVEARMTTIGEENLFMPENAQTQSFVNAAASIDHKGIEDALAAAKAAANKLKDEAGAELSKHARELKDFAIDKLLEVVASLAK
jgi:hypothetical protein